MIYLLVMALLVFLPGNLILFAIALSFFTPSYFVKHEIHHKIFYVLMIWMLIGCFFAKSFLISFYGCVYRCEGWLMWLILSRLAWSYWSEFDELIPLLFIVFALCVIYMTANCFLNANYFNNLNVAGFAAIAFSILCNVNKPLALISIFPVVLLTGNRSAIIASSSSVFISLLFMSKKIKMYSMIAAILIGLSCLSVPSVRQRFEHINFTTMGNGLRCQLESQAVGLYGKLPITGLGLDSLVFHLSNPSGVTVQANSVPDRTHNVACDIVLMTGWIGYLICLILLSVMIWITLNNPNLINISCLSGIVSWIVFGMFNPQGCAAHALMLTCVFGITKEVKHE